LRTKGKRREPLFPANLEMRMIFDGFKNLNPILQAFLATSFNWFLTVCGGILVLLF
jgi:hypothetical protein